MRNDQMVVVSMDPDLKPLEKEMFKSMQLETGWILTNVCYADKDNLNSILNFRIDEGPSLTQVINNILNASVKDLQMIDQLMFILGNITGTNQ